MRKILIVIVFAFVASGISAQMDDCLTGLREGTFVSTDPSIVGYKMVRTLEHQIEYRYANEEIISDITWLNENQYRIVITDDSNSKKNWDKMPVDYVFTVIECRQDIHKVEILINKQKVTFEFKKIN